MSKKPTNKTPTRGAASARTTVSRPSRRSAAPPSLSTDALFQDWSEFLRLLTRHRARFLLIGGHAMAVHARPRHTEDLDLFLDATKANAPRVLRALADFGFGSVAPRVELLERPEKVFMLGRLPYRIDLLTRIDGVDFRQAWAGKVEAQIGGLRVFVIGKRELIQNKLAAGRPKDLADVVALGPPEQTDSRPPFTSRATRRTTRP
jgi:hypothetical protein